MLSEEQSKTPFQLKQGVYTFVSDVDRVEILLVMVGEEEKFLEERGGQVSSDHNSPPSSTYGVSTALANGTTSSVHLSYRECSNPRGQNTVL